MTKPCAGLLATLGLTACDHVEPAVGAPDEQLFALSEVPLWSGNDTDLAIDPGPDHARMRAAYLASGAPTVHYVNFSDGTLKLTSGIDDASQNRSQICHASPFPAYRGTEADKQAFIRVLTGIMAEFNVVITTSRPAASPYSMEVVGPMGNGCYREDSGGVAPMDCRNNNLNSVSFTFDGSPVTTAQEAAHGWLEHVDVSCDVMGAGYSKKSCPDRDWGYKDDTVPIFGGPNCGVPTQNSYQKMKQVLGLWDTAAGPRPDPWRVHCTDEAGPTVSLDLPTDGENVSNDFWVRVSATDDCGPNARAVLTLTGTAAAPSEIKGAGPYDWRLTGIADRDEQEITVDVFDGGDKKTSKTIKVRVGRGGAAPSADGGAGGGGGGGGCSTAGAAGGAWWLAMALAVVVMRRRRSGSAR